VLSLALVAALVWPQIDPQKGLWHGVRTIFALDRNSLVEGFKLNPWLGLSLLSLCLAFLALQIRVEGALRDGFSRFWRRFWGHAPGAEADDPEEESAQKAA
jgi:hypothetical protein